MKRLFFLVAVSLYAVNINDLFTAVKKAPETQIDNIFVKEIKTAKNRIKNSLLPTVTLTSSYTHYSIPTAIRPLPPTESSKLLRSNSSLPFSQNIARIGFVFSMPLFVKEIYDNKEKVSILMNNARLKSKLNLIKREALIVGYVSKLNYLFKLKKAINDKKNSIQTTIDALKVGVENGMIPKFKLLRLQDKLNQISVNLNDIDSNINNLKSKIYALTKIEVNAPVDLHFIEFNKGSFFMSKILKNNILASQKDVEAKKDTFFPKVLLKIQGNRAFAKSYNTDDNIALNYASAGIYLKWDIFNKKDNSDIKKAKLEYLKNTLTLQKVNNELTAEVKKLNNNLKLVNNSIKKTKESIEIKKRLLNDAKTAFKLNRMTVDEYLSYEDALSFERANLAKYEALKNSYLANLAVIYGKNLERICK